MILTIWKFARTSLLTLFLGMLIMSIQFSDLMEVRNSELNFFLPFSRFWELLFSSALAFVELRYGRTKKSDIDTNVANNWLILNHTQYPFFRHQHASSKFFNIDSNFRCYFSFSVLFKRRPCGKNTFS